MVLSIVKMAYPSQNILSKIRAILAFCYYLAKNKDAAERLYSKYL
jgi:hypothetical protein